MKSHTLFLFGLILSCFVALIQADPKVYATTPNFSLNATETDGFPSITFALLNHTSDDAYSISLSLLFEADVDDDGDYTPVINSSINLSSMKWDVGHLTRVGDDSSIELLADAPTGFTRFGIFYLVFHISNNATANQTTASVKFDIMIANYTWVSQNTTSKLVLIFNQTASSGQQSGAKFNQDSNLYTLDNSWFIIDSNASVLSTDLSPTTPLPVAMNYENSGDNMGIWIVYDQFAFGFIDDPLFGVGTPPVTPKGGSKGWKIALGIILSLAAVAVVVAVILYLRRRKRYVSI